MDDLTFDTWTHWVLVHALCFMAFFAYVIRSWAPNAVTTVVVCMVWFFAFFGLLLAAGGWCIAWWEHEKACRMAAIEFAAIVQGQFAVDTRGEGPE